MHKETQTTEWWSWATRIKIGGRWWHFKYLCKNNFKYLCKLHFKVFFKQALNLKYLRECVWTMWKCHSILGDTNLCFSPGPLAKHSTKDRNPTPLKWVIIATTFGLGSGSLDLFRVRSLKIIQVTRMSLIKPDSPFLKSWQRAFTSLHVSFLIMSILK